MKFKEYKKQCPFNIKFDTNYEKKCELFNINANSRYKYQYICSYDASNVFSLSKKIKNNRIICTKAKTSINNLESNSSIYYCSRTDIPKNNTYINIKYCNNNIGYKRVIIIYIFYCLLFFLPFYDFFFSFGLAMIISDQLAIRVRRERRERSERRERREIREIRENLFNVIIGPFIGNNNNNSRCSTKISNNSIFNNNFIKEKTKNIIIENKKEIEINVSIQQLNKKNTNEQINLEDIFLSSNNNSNNKRVNAA